MSKKVGELKPAPYNPRKISQQQLDSLARAMEEFGDLSGIVKNIRTGNLVGGHQRIKNLNPDWEIHDEKHEDSTGTVRLGYIETPQGRWQYREVDWSEKKELAANLAANKHGGEFDIPKVKEMLTHLDDGEFDVDLTGFDEIEVRDLFDNDPAAQDPPEDNIPDPPKNPVSKPGDIWILGKHKLLCGDSTSPADVSRLLDGKAPDMVFTDPPYGIGYEYRMHDDAKDTNVELVELVFKNFPCGKVWTPGLMNLGRDIVRFGQAKVVVWSKKFAAAGNGIGGASTWEPILVINPTSKRLNNDVLEIMTDREVHDGKSLREHHPCPKPIALFGALVVALSKREDLIVDPFMGSGTTLMACERSKRKCYGIEIDPAYCDVIIKRWENLTGKKAELIDQPTEEKE